LSGYHPGVGWFIKHGDACTHGLCTGIISLKINRILIWKNKGSQSQEIYSPEYIAKLSSQPVVQCTVDETAAVLVFIWRSCDVIIAGGNLVALASGLQMKRLL